MQPATRGRHLEHWKSTFLSLFQLAQQTFQIFQKLLKVTYVRNPAPPGVKGLQEVKIKLAFCPSAAVHLDRPWSTDGRREEEGREGQVLVSHLILILYLHFGSGGSFKSLGGGRGGGLKKFNESVKFPLCLKT